MAAPVDVLWRHREAPGRRCWRRWWREARRGWSSSGVGGVGLGADSAACEGRSLLRAFVTAAVQRAERVLVVLFDIPRERFEAGLSPAVKERLLYRDGFTDPLGWSGPAPDLQAGPLTRLLALLHGDLHPPGLLQALGALASTQLTLGGPPPAPGAPRLAGVLSRPRRGGPRQKTSGSPGDSGGWAPPHPLTFRLRLSAAERAARAAVPPPYQLSSPRRSTLLQMPGSTVCALEPPEDEDLEDPDDDLDL
ncbi:elongator complex protein 5 [Morus bassanus]